MTMFLNQKDVFLMLLYLCELRTCKKDRSIFQFAFRFLAFPEIGEILKTHAHKKYDLQHNRNIKMLRIMVFSVDHQIKMP